MRELVAPALVFLCLVAAALGALFLVGRLPEDHRKDNTHSVIKLAAGIFVLMASLVLGLLVNASKNTFETVDRNVHAFATELILFDRTLRSYGPEADETRRRLLAYAQRALEGTWPASGKPVVDDRTAEHLLDDVEASLRAIPQQSERADLLRGAWQRLQNVIQLRWVLIGAADGTLYTPLFVMLVGWLILVFASIGFNAPGNPVVIATLVVSAFVITASLYLVLDLDKPFDGPVRVSPTSMQQAIAVMTR